MLLADCCWCTPVKPSPFCSYSQKGPAWQNQQGWPAREHKSSKIQIPGVAETAFAECLLCASACTFTALAMRDTWAMEDCLCSLCTSEHWDWEPVSSFSVRFYLVTSTSSQGSKWNRMHAVHFDSRRYPGQESTIEPIMHHLPLDLQKALVEASRAQHFKLSFHQHRRLGAFYCSPFSPPSTPTHFQPAGRCPAGNGSAAPTHVQPAENETTLIGLQPRS